MPIFLFIIAISLLWGTGGVLVKKGFTNLSPWQTYALDTIASALPLWLLYGVLNGGNLFTLTPLAIFTALFVSVFYAFFYITIHAGQLSLTYPIIASYPIFTVILALLFLGERLNIPALLGIGLTVIGMILISIPQKISYKFEKWVYLAIFVALGFGVAGYLEKLAFRTVNNATFVMFLGFAQAIIVVLWRTLKKDSFPKITTKSALYSLLGLMLFNLGNIIFFHSLERGLASIIVPLSNTYVVITVIFSFWFLKEKVAFHQILGIASVVLGVILVGFNTS